MAGEASRAVVAQWRETLRSLAADHLGEADADVVAAIARPAVQLVATDGVVESHLGGGPIVGAGFAWPSWHGEPLQLVGVLSLGELVDNVLDIDLPASGYVSIFYDAEHQAAWGYDAQHRDGWRVTYTEVAAAVAVTAPASVRVYSRVGLAPRQILTIPDAEEPVIDSLFAGKVRPVRKKRHRRFGRRRAAVVTGDRRDGYYELAEAWEQIDGGREVGHQVGGWPRLIQGPVFSDAAVVSAGVSLGSVAEAGRPGAAELAARYDEWSLLLQLDSDERAGWMWGDLGALYFMAKDTTPSPQRLEEAWMIYQCH